MKARKKRAVKAGVPNPRPDTNRVTPDRKQWLVLLGLCALTLLAYSNSFSAGFTLDNKGLLLGDPRIRELSGQNLGLIFHHTYWWPYAESGLYRPFTTLTYLFNYAILGNADSPAGYHWVNLLLHAVNVLLVYFLARRLIGKLWPSAWIAAIWAVHPVLTESVTNIVGRADLLAGATLLGGFLMYLKSTEAEGKARWMWLVGLAIVTIIGVFCKESAITILGVIVIYELAWWKERKAGKALLLGCIAIVPALEAMWYQRAAVFAGLPPVEFPLWDNPIVGANFWTAKLTAVKLIAKYLALLVWPAKLSCDYSFNQIKLASRTPQDWLAWTAVAVVIVAVLLMCKVQRPIFFVAGFAFVTLLPTSNLLFPIGTIFAERFLYLPALLLAFSVVIACYGIARWTRISRLAPLLLCLILAAFTFRTWARNRDWHDDISLWTAAARVSPNSYKPHRALAATLYDLDPTHANIDQVISEADKSVAILNSLPDAWNNADVYRRAGMDYLTKGDMVAMRDASGHMTSTPASLQAYGRALQLLLHAKTIVVQSSERLAVRADTRNSAAESEKSETGELDREISQAYVGLNEGEKALKAAASAKELDPLNPESYQQLSAAFSANAQPDEAAIALIQGSFMTSDATLREQLIALYRNGLDKQGCAIVNGANGPAFNPSCAIVRAHTCAAVAATLPEYRQLNRTDAAEELKRSAMQTFNCPEDLFKDSH